MQILGLFKIDVFHSQKRLFFVRMLHQSVFLVSFALKQKMEKDLIFRQKRWTIPFGEMQILGLF